MRGANVCKNSVGEDMAFAITEDHVIYVWGGGGNGRTGYNPDAPKSMQGGQNNWLEPTIVYDLQGEDIIDVSVGASHCIASSAGGDCFVWGDGNVGQLGLGHFENHPTIAINNSFSAVNQVDCGSNHSLSVTRNGRVCKCYTSNILLFLFY
jgi:alpha-tubulin suppressor-like RCC1 family protein